MSELERALRELGRSLEFPPEPDLSASVAGRLRADLARRRRRRGPLAIAFATAALALAVAVAVPPARSALLDLLGLSGATAERVGTLPTVPRAGDLALGRRVSLARAEREADYDVLVPVGRASRVYLDASVPGAKVSVVWSERDVRVVLSQFRGEGLPFVSKLVGPETRLEHVTVRGARGAWISGPEHVVLWRDANGRIREETRRLAGSVLLWERGGVTYRLEADVDRAAALEIASALR